MNVSIFSYMHLCVCIRISMFMYIRIFVVGSYICIIYILMAQSASVAEQALYEGPRAEKKILYRLEDLYWPKTLHWFVRLVILDAPCVAVLCMIVFSSMRTHI
jgi:hypothetical protein